MPTPYYGNLARVLHDFMGRLDRVLNFPSYNYVIHTSPIGEEINDHYHWHIEMMPS